METIVNYDVNKIKNELKTLAEEQRFYKRQRKSDKTIFKERVITPKEAQWKHQANRQKLRLMYAAYGLMRGKPFSVTENKYSEEEHPLNKFKPQISDVLTIYMIAETVEK